MRNPSLLVGFLFLIFVGTASADPVPTVGGPHDPAAEMPAEKPDSTPAAPPAETPDTPAPRRASPSSAFGESPQLEAVDIPTAYILDPQTFSTAFRFYNRGGITSRLAVAPFKYINLGIYFDTQRVIGSDDPHMITPRLFFKLHMYDGSDYIPALALGYDNQGYLYQEGSKQFLHREKGLYLVGSHEIFLPNFELHAGLNKYNFDNNSIFGFFGATWKIAPAFALLAEYDNIRNGIDNRVNLGGRLWIAPFFNVDLAARNVGRGEGRGGERIIRLNYVGNFPF